MHYLQQVDILRVKGWTREARCFSQSLMEGAITIFKQPIIPFCVTQIDSIVQQTNETHSNQLQIILPSIQ
jgi:hypothetical protein